MTDFEQLGRETWLEEAFIRFEPGLHPRDPKGQFASKLGGLKPGQTAIVPWGVRVRRPNSGRGFLVGRTHGNLAGPSLSGGIAHHDTAASAAHAVFASQQQHERMTGEKAPQTFKEPHSPGVNWTGTTDEKLNEMLRNAEKVPDFEPGWTAALRAEVDRRGVARAIAKIEGGGLSQNDPDAKYGAEAARRISGDTGGRFPMQMQRAPKSPGPQRPIDLVMPGSPISARITKAMSDRTKFEADMKKKRKVPKYTGYIGGGLTLRKD